MKRIKSGGIYEEKIGYCRAVVAGGFIHISGTTAQGSDISEDVVEQCQSALNAIEKTLKEANSDFSKVIRVRYYLPSAQDFPKCFELLAKTFGDNPPAATMIESGLINPKYKIEIEVTALP